ncbi:hypothetical protein MIMGU_mgv1a015690mg [Erythranthe guttata]|uniref:Uncharacterized protein n=1 Tax=Erythranthe guttata TaxID=4155 RepID=A0A022Q1J7_ERYGU|nr:PREDICTED: uncharacterized protein LOC105976124 [Erythranthe guttata]EYU21644.1 hypothetical protein MIMGU_mgv1a015690mg [Erythranthe guttata]|eukprot:XP_012856871.1 PREDICTED: uncharacterized protein LOC105976124 [Erythranthe guttata]
MACCPFPRPTSLKHHHQSHRVPPPFYNSTTATVNLMTFFSPLSSSSSQTNLHRSFPLKRIPWSGRCHAAGPQPEPPSEEQLSPLSGVTKTFTRFKILCRSSLLFYFGYLFSSGLLRGIEETVADQITVLDLENNFVSCRVNCNTYAYIS